VRRRRSSAWLRILSMLRMPWEGNNLS
jgi:hypothetical protein